MQTASLQRETTLRDALARAVSPLSSYQRRVWRLVGTHAERALYERICVRIAGPLPVAALARAVDAVGRRHAILRAVFFDAGGQVVQCVRSTAAALLIVDLRGLPQDERARAAARLTRRERQPAFDVRRGPPMRTALFQMSATDHLWLACVHHLVFDGGSRAVLMRDLESIFLSPSAPHATAPQYRDVMRRETRPETLVPHAVRARTVAGRLRDLPSPPATLPSDRPRSAYRTRRGDLIVFDVPDAVVRALRDVCRAERLSLFMLLLGALAIVLRWASGLADVACGIPVANRMSVEAERTIGPFINILVVPLRATAGMRVRDVVAHARDAMLGALADRDVPFDDVLAALAPGRALDNYGPADAPPLFRACASFEDETDAGTSVASGVAGGQAPGLTLTPFEPADAIAGCDLTISFTVSGDRLAGGVLYPVELFDRATVTRFIASFLAVLSSLQRAWHRPLSDLPAA